MIFSWWLIQLTYNENSTKNIVFSISVVGSAMQGRWLAFKLFCWHTSGPYTVVKLGETEHMAAVVCLSSLFFLFQTIDLHDAKRIPASIQLNIIRLLLYRHSTYTMHVYKKNYIATGGIRKILHFYINQYNRKAHTWQISLGHKT